MPAAVAPLGLVLLGLASAFDIGALYSMAKGPTGPNASPGVPLKIRLMITNAIESELRKGGFGDGGYEIVELIGMEIEKPEDNPYRGNMCKVE